DPLSHSASARYRFSVHTTEGSAFPGSRGSQSPRSRTRTRPCRPASASGGACAIVPPPAPLPTTTTSYSSSSRGASTSAIELLHQQVVVEGALDAHLGLASGPDRVEEVGVH